MMDSLRILVLDDHEPNRFLLVNQLASFGHNVFEARSGIEALGLLLSNDYDVLFTDCNMPGMDGHELVRELRAFESSQQAPRCFVVGVTANARGEARERCLLSGMDDCLFKPVRAKDLDTCLSSMKTGIVSNFPADSVNLNYIVDLFDGDLNLSGKLFSELYENNTRDLYRLDEIIISGSIAELRSLTHHIMNGARMVGDEDLVQSILYFEDVVRFGKSDVRYSRALQSIRTNLISLQSSLDAWLINNNV
jgi:two-component system sensor histidine kinase EvgS